MNMQQLTNTEFVLENDPSDVRQANLCSGHSNRETPEENSSVDSDLPKNSPEKSGQTDCDNCDWLPPKPEEPLASDCCGTGCTPCVFDIYDQEMIIWEKECKKLQERSNNLSAENERVISPTEYHKFEIISATHVSRDSWIYRFRIPHDLSLGLHVGQHIILRENQENLTITREYTPISDRHSHGYFDILIKIYEDGRMSQVVKNWKVGQVKEWRGPFGRFSYLSNTFRRVVMLAAGTGIAPMLQVAREIVSNDDDETFVHLLYACRTYDEILMKQEIDSWTNHWNFTVLYVLSKDTPEETANRISYSDQIHYGRIDEDLIRKEVTCSGKSTLVLICGTKSFDKDMIKYLKNLCHCEEDIFKF